VEKDPLHGLHACQIWIPLIFTCGAPKNPCVCSSCWQWRGTSSSHFGCLLDHLKLPWHLWMWQSMMRHVKACTEYHGGHLEHLLQMYSFTYNLEIKCFQTHADMAIYSCFGIRNSCPSLSIPFSHNLYIHQFIWKHCLRYYEEMLQTTTFVTSIHLKI
jgi:hypothetical protein